MLTEDQKSRWLEQIMCDFPNMHRSIANDLLDVYQKDAEWVHEQAKIIKKECKGKLETGKSLDLKKMETLDIIGRLEVDRIHQWYGEVNKGTQVPFDPPVLQSGGLWGSEAPKKYPVDNIKQEDVASQSQQTDSERPSGTETGTVEDHPESVPDALFLK